MSTVNLFNGQDSSISGVDPEELKEFLNFVRPVCHSCGTVIGHLREPFLERLASGDRPDVVFSSFGINNYCCRSNISNPARLPPGIIYNNPRIQGKVEFSSQRAEELFGQLAVNSDINRGALVDVSFESDTSAGNKLDSVTRVAITPQINVSSLPQAASSSTTIPSNTTLGDANEEEEVERAIPETAAITDDNFDNDFLRSLEPQKLLQETPDAIPTVSGPLPSIPKVPSLPGISSTRLSGLSAPRLPGRGGFIPGLGPRREEERGAPSTIFGPSSSTTAVNDTPDNGTIVPTDSSTEAAVTSMFSSGNEEGPIFGQTGKTTSDTMSSYIYIPRTYTIFDETTGTRKTIRQYS